MFGKGKVYIATSYEFEAEQEALTNPFNLGFERAWCH